MIKILLDKDFAYQAEDGIYFRVAKADKYGGLAQLNLESIKTQSRIKTDQYDKETPNDFALWKFWQASDGEVGWDADFGEGRPASATLRRGRPGWHIECSAMISAVLGATIDIHLGGIDLIFPHHTNEIAQSEAVTGQPLANFWSHVAFVNMNDSKMAKSEGNVITLADLVARDFSPLAYRYWLLSAHYRTTINFSWEALEGAATALKKLQNHVADLALQTQSVRHSMSHNQEYLDKFTEAINNDLNLPVALSIVWQLLDDQAVAPADPSKEFVRAGTLATILEFDKVLGLDLISATKLADIPEEIKNLLTERESARLAGDFPRADHLREQITTTGYTIDDTPTGPKLRKI